MNENLTYEIKFSDNEINFVEQDSNSQFMTLEIDVCRSGYNTHRIPFSREAVKKSASSVKGKPILAHYNIGHTDFEGHEIDEFAVGFFTEEEPTLIEKDDELFLRQKAKIWKEYFADTVEIFKDKQGKTDVSAEIRMLKGEDPTSFEDGYVDLFSILGCTLLGVKPSIQGAEARVLTFSEMKSQFEKEDGNGKTYKVNKTELSETAWGEVDKTKLRNSVMSAKNRDTLVKEVYAKVEDGWQKAPSEKLKYPIMELKGDIFYYNRYGLSSALAYAKQENETDVISKINKLYDKFDLSDDKDMEQKQSKKFSNTIFKLAYSAEYDDIVIINEKTGEMCGTLEDARLGKDKKQMSDKTKIDLEEEKKKPDSQTEDESENKEEDAKKDDKSKEEELEDPKGKDEKKDEKKLEDEKDEKEMSFDMASCCKALTAMLEADTKEEMEEARKMYACESDDYNILMSKIEEMKASNRELKKFKAEKEAEEAKFSVDSVLASVKGDLKEEDFEALSEEGKKCKFEDVENFTLKVKAFAYEHGVKKSNRDNGFIKMGVNTKRTQPTQHMNVFEKYRKNK